MGKASEGEGTSENSGAGGSTGPPRLACPSCGSERTQPFNHAGPAARVNMKCRDCGHLFKDRNLRR